MTTALQSLRKYAALAAVAVGLSHAAPGYSQAMNTTGKSDADKVRVILVGDSTMATRTGYGDAFCARFVAGVECINLARGGRSSKSFRVEGLWDHVQKILADNKASETPRTTYVLIQFGHNDQPGKAERSTDLATEFPANIARYVDEVNGGGGVPILVTPLTRRTFRNGIHHNDLVPWADVTRRIAREKSVALIDLNAKSATAVAQMGTTEADTLAEEPPPPFPAYGVANTGDAAKPEANPVAKSRFDYTHLGAKGAALFSRMVARELAQVAPALATLLRAESHSQP